MVPKALAKGGLVITENNITRKYNVMELKERTYLCQSYEVWSTEHEDIYISMQERPSRRCLHNIRSQCLLVFISKSFLLFTLVCSLHQNGDRNGRRAQHPTRAMVSHRRSVPELQLPKDIQHDCQQVPQTRLRNQRRDLASKWLNSRRYLETFNFFNQMRKSPHLPFHSWPPK